MEHSHAPDSPEEGHSLADERFSTPARRMTVYQTREGRPRWVLHMQAVFWRVLMNLGMFFHRLAPPRPPKPNFSRTIPSTISGRPGQITLNFYVPKDFDAQRLLWVNRREQNVMSGGQDGALEEVESESGDLSGGETPTKGKGKLSKLSTISEFGDIIRRRSTTVRRWGGYPVVINFHGGGFTLGNSWDDARWCQTVVNECHAIVVGVDYRLAPEHPFPTAVEDGVDAVKYVHKYAEEFGIDRDKIALSGFSSGGNMCFTVPLRLYDEMQGFPRDDLDSGPPTGEGSSQRALHGKASFLADGAPSASSSTAHLTQPQENETAAYDHATSSPLQSSKRRETIETIEQEAKALQDIKIACLVPWYPPVDYTRTREQRRATCRRADQELPALFTDLFDESYLHPPHTISLNSPYLSPGVAPTSLLKNALPQEIIMHTCEWDMLLDEGEVFKDRLNSDEIGKHVWYKMVDGVPHGWDKAPNPWKPTPGVKEYYLKACKEMRRVFGPEKGVGRPPMERLTTKGWPSAAPRGSISVVR